MSVSAQPQLGFLQTTHQFNQNHKGFAHSESKITKSTFSGVWDLKVFLAQLGPKDKYEHNSTTVTPSFSDKRQI